MTSLLNKQANKCAEELIGIFEMKRNMYPENADAYNNCIHFISRYLTYRHVFNILRDYMQAWVINKLYMFSLELISRVEIRRYIRAYMHVDFDFYNSAKLAGYDSYVAYCNSKGWGVTYSVNQRPNPGNTYYRNNLLEVL